MSLSDHLALTAVCPPLSFAIHVTLLVAAGAAHSQLIVAFLIVHGLRRQCHRPPQDIAPAASPDSWPTPGSPPLTGWSQFISYSPRNDDQRWHCQQAGAAEAEAKHGW